MMRQLRDEYTRRAMGQSWDGSDLLQLSHRMCHAVSSRPAARTRRLTLAVAVAAAAVGFIAINVARGAR